MLDSIITSKTRLKLLVKFFVSATNSGHLRGLAGEFEESTNAIRKELNQLTDAGYLNKQQAQNKVVYKANTSHPLFNSLQSLIRSYLGLDQIVEYLLERTGKVQEISLVGDYAAGIDSGIIEVSLRGQELDEAYVLQAADKMAEILGKKIKMHINSTNHPTAEIVLYREG
ncbi:ArsR family transcriptional regulator [Sphingobacterium oryzagri]|uniref:ArsR family transcriptional regulator n=1 Tax=Sphingobacterium oryzagri TaxID=3025669 RepID=A0ABY7WH84_9SPHI|nr:ArsR family transcriptional regulator [Sphingobacterium sp. KACC 22765]WDF68956.1 ArsR family transcriptional regulator [Sphingobacterium sp. KACC 22765]